MDDSWIDGPEHISECGGCDSWCEACCDVNENAYQEWLKNEKAKVETQKEKDVHGLANLTAKAIYLKDKKPITTAYLREVRDANLGKNMKTAKENAAFWNAKLNKAKEEGKPGHIITAYLREVRDANLENNVAAAETNVAFWTAKLDKARKEGKTGQSVTSYLRGLCDSKRVLLKEMRAYMKETIPSKKM
jgi:uncharacterized protein YdbL (DUF1318 family)